MDRPPARSSIVLVLALTGCATHAAVQLSSRVGPQPMRSRSYGDLIVFSATRVSVTEQSEYPIHTDYVLFDEHGARLQRIANSAGAFGADPVTLALPAGSYRVKALEQSGGYVVVPLSIEPGQTTVVDLDGSALPQQGIGSSDWVRLPDGHVVGWRAQERAR